ncbi:hypothetical protein ABT56_05500 [Photobacterium aquae]|uniref:Metal-binding protein n=1 Tax=Photobacterium aquae TaxID=1195763 RepID=A0A0J1H703_9GAMM|nr:YheV family putative zinc ribbon protein [Photobacterium aquae]KLV07520.1 hypothetical protein ABT56_05500 [Photobacterium aquae]
MTKKRFIAGAVCPACKQQDTLRWWQEHDIERVECVACGHHDLRAPQSVEQSGQLSAQTKQQVIGIFKPDDEKGDLTRNR